MQKTSGKIKKRSANPPCGLCGKSRKPRQKTECCGNWVCGSEFEKLENPPKFEPTHCSKCGTRIVLPDGGYSSLCGVYRCDNCPVTDKEREEIIREYKKKAGDK